MDEPLTVLISGDMEGVWGVNSQGQCVQAHADYATGWVRRASFVARARATFVPLPPLLSPRCGAF